MLEAGRAVEAISHLELRGQDVRVLAAVDLGEGVRRVNFLSPATLPFVQAGRVGEPLYSRIVFPPFYLTL